MKRAILAIPVIAFFLIILPGARAADDETDVTTEESKESISVVEHADGSIDVTVTTVREGKTETQTVNAASVAELRDKYPKIYVRYAEYLLQQEFKKQLREQFAALLEKATPGGDNTALSDRFDQLMKRIAAIFGGGNVGEAGYKAERLGLTFENASAALKAQLGIEATGGVVVTDVAAGSLAEKAGFKKYDVLTSIGDSDVSDTGQLEKVLAVFKDVNELTCSIIHQGQKQDITMKFQPEGETNPAPPAGGGQD
jgi:C-terminal processing protease CtpA/Prc